MPTRIRGAAADDNLAFTMRDKSANRSGGTGSGFKVAYTFTA
jgi:hypothetical protein